MPARVVVYDPGCELPESFARDACLGDAIVHLHGPPDAYSVRRAATILVLVASAGDSTVAGMLASSDERQHAHVVLFVDDARRHRRLVVLAARHGALVLIGAPPSALAACLRDLLVLRPLSCEAQQALHAGAASLSAQARSLLLVAADHASPETGAADIARALGISSRTLSRRVRSVGFRSVFDLIAGGRLLRALSLTGAEATLQRQAQAGGFPNVRSLVRARQQLLASSSRDDQPPLSISSLTNALRARCSCDQPLPTR